MADNIHQLRVLRQTCLLKICTAAVNFATRPGNQDHREIAQLIFRYYNQLSFYYNSNDDDENNIINIRRQRATTLQALVDTLHALYHPHRGMFIDALLDFVHFSVCLVRHGRYPGIPQELELWRELTRMHTDCDIHGLAAIYETFPLPRAASGSGRREEEEVHCRITFAAVTRAQTQEFEVRLRLAISQGQGQRQGQGQEREGCRITAVSRRAGNMTDNI